MSWLRLEDNMLDHPKWIRAIREGGEGVTTVWLRLVSWCSRNLTDGVIPGDMVAEVAQVRAGKTRSKALRALEEARLITRGDHEEITIVDYLERNPSRSQVQADRERRARAQQNRRVTGNVTGHAPTTVPSCNDVPSRPVPIPSPSHSQKSEIARAQPVEVREPFKGSGGVSRVYSMPGEQPTQAYLDEAVMRGVSREQATSTWIHYYGAGLPERGIERLYEWLCQRAKERANSTARAAAMPRGRGSGASPPLEPTAKHVAFARAHGVEITPIVNGLVVEGVVDALGVRGALDELGKRLSLAARKVSAQ